jgi:predicted O-methyltransferase YrrM
MFFFRISRYLKHLLVSKNRRGFGIHSPFVFDLISRIFRNKIDPAVVLMIEEIRKSNITDKRIISVTDLGAGSEKMKSRLRKVSDIARYSAIPVKYGRLLSNMAAEFGAPAIVELGTSLGISTMYLALAAPGANVYTIEGCLETSEIARENFRIAGSRNIRIMNGAFDDMLPELIKEGISPGLVFIDGDHRKEPMLRYFSRIAEISNDKTVVILDDIHHSAQMEETWNEIRKDEKVSVTVDLLRMGVVFFRKGTSHHDYVVKY